MRKTIVSSFGRLARKAGVRRPWTGRREEIIDELYGLVITWDVAVKKSVPLRYSRVSVVFPDPLEDQVQRVWIRIEPGVNFGENDTLLILHRSLLGDEVSIPGVVKYFSQDRGFDAYNKDEFPLRVLVNSKILQAVISTSAHVVS